MLNVSTSCLATSTFPPIAVKTSSFNTSISIESSSSFKYLFTSSIALRVLLKAHLIKLSSFKKYQLRHLYSQPYLQCLKDPAEPYTCLLSFLGSIITEGTPKNKSINLMIIIFNGATGSLYPICK